MIPLNIILAQLQIPVFGEVQDAAKFKAPHVYECINTLTKQDNAEQSQAGQTSCHTYLTKSSKSKKMSGITHKPFTQNRVKG